MIWAAVKTVGTFLFDRFGGKALMLGGGVLALFAWWQIDRAVIAQRKFNEGAANAKAGFEQHSNELAGRMEDAADAARRGDPLKRLRERYCTDC